MIDAEAFLKPARARGFDFYTGVPCSFLTPIINRAISDPANHYVGAASEGEAIAIAAGAWLAGRRTAVMCQNSGLGNTVNPLTSLNAPFQIPTLMIVTWRGQPGQQDEPQHELMGRITQALLDVMGIRHRRFPTDEAEVDAALDEAMGEMDRTGLPFVLVMEKGNVRHETLEEREPMSHPRGRLSDFRELGATVTRAAVLERFLGLVPDDAAVIATTGKCGRELFTLADREQHLYQVGSMGCASAMALGVALNTDRPVFVLDGDGAALMKLGNVATIGAEHPSNLTHILLDNGVHDSTGGQATVSPAVDFASVALGCGYSSGAVCDSLAGFETAFLAAGSAPGPRFIHMRIAAGSMTTLGRPTVKPHEVAQRFKRFLVPSV